MIFLNQPRDFLLRDLAPNVSLGRINQELRHAQIIDILQADGEAPITRPLPDLWVGVIFEFGKNTPCCFRRTYSFILSCHTQTLSSLSNDKQDAPPPGMFHSRMSRSKPLVFLVSDCIIFFHGDSIPNIHGVTAQILRPLCVRRSCHMPSYSFAA